MMRAWWIVAALAGAARAETAAEILALTDRAHSAFTDLTIEGKLVIREPAGAPREVKFSLALKGESKRMLRLLDPPDIRGMNILVDGNSAYVVLPAFGNRVRRIVAHDGKAFLGSDFSNDDLADDGTFTGVYQPTLAAADATSFVLELKLLPDQTREFPSLKLWVDKKHHQATRIEFFDAKGQRARTETRAGFLKDAGEHVTPRQITMVDHRRADHTSVVEITSVKANANLPDEEFTKAALQR